MSENVLEVEGSEEFEIQSWRDVADAHWNYLNCTGDTVAEKFRGVEAAVVTVTNKLLAWGKEGRLWISVNKPLLSIFECSTRYTPSPDKGKITGIYADSWEITYDNRLEEDMILVGVGHDARMICACNFPSKT